MNGPGEMFLCGRYSCRMLEARCVEFQQGQREACDNCLQGAAIASRFGVKVQVRVVVTCRGPECRHPAVRHGFCQGHWKQLKAHGEMTPLRRWVPTNGARCCGPGCYRRAAARGMCRAHHRQWIEGKELTRIKVLGHGDAQ